MKNAVPVDEKPTPFQKRCNAFLLLFWLFAGISQAQTIRYVKPTATGSGDGSSWNNASANLQAMIDALGTDQVWVAAGTYKPTTGSDRTISFSMKAGVKIYGSFAGTETALSQRTSTVMTANKSILSGDLNNDDVITGSGSTLSIMGNGENSYQIIFNNNNGLTVSNSLLDGFTITGGNANSSTGSPEVDGGGMYNGRSSPSISNVTFTGNTAKFDAGGMYNGGCSPSLTNVIFVRNSCLSSGGAIANHDSSPSLSYVTFDGNKGQFGGGIADYGSSSPSLSNVIFKGNYGSSGGGIFNYHTSSPILTNVIFSGNTSQRAGGIYNAGGTVTIKNTLFWGNTASISGPDILHISGSSTNISYSLLQAAQSNYTTGFNLGAGMLYAQNPLFVNAADLDGADNIFGTADDGLQLLPCSPAVNTGNNNGVASTDITGNPRTIGGTVDMGAYEYQGNAVSGTRIHVNATAAANGDGSSWAKAYTDLQTALANARLCPQITEIWVAAGTYYPTTNPTDKTASFVMKNGVAIYGGFTGTETNLNDRNWTTNPTILSGDIDHATDPLVVTGSGSTLSITGNRGNSYHVIFNDNNGLTGTAVLDGFTITGGRAFVSGGGPNPFGGGMYNNASSPSVSNCRFLSNSATTGGGMYNQSSSPSLSNCSFSSNSAGSGGGMYNNSSSPSLMDCHFSGNSSNLGGGMANIESSSPSLVNCSFTGNYGDRVGGGMHNLSSSLSLTNCSFSENKASRDLGGGMYSDASSLSLINCSFLGNQAGGGGGAMLNLDLLSSTFTNCIFLGNQAGGMFNLGCSPSLVNCTLSGNSGGGMINFSSSSPSLKNCILWGNSSEVRNDNSSNPTYTKTLVKGLIVGGFQGTEDPLFVNQPSVGLGTTGDLRLRPCSPVLNAGNNADNTNTTDLDGNARIFNSASGGTIDLGAYEYQSALVVTPSVSVNHPITCTGTNGSITLSGFLNSTTYSVTYKKNTNAVAAANFTSNGSGVITLTDLGAGNYTDIVATYGSCVSNAATATLTDPTKPTATIAGTTTVCQNSTSPSVTFTGQSGTTPYTFTYKINSGTSQTVSTAGGNSSVTVSVPTGISGVFTYSLESVSNPNNCSQTQTGSAVITVNPVPTATIAGTTTVCQNSPSPNITFTGSNATAPYTFTYKINGGSPQTVTTASGSSVTVAAPTGTAGVFTYTLVSVSESSSTACSQTQMGSAAVTVNSLPTATITGTTTVCQNSPSPNVTFTGANATAPYTFTYKINGGSPQTVTTSSGNSVTVAAPTGTAGVFAYTLVGVSESSSTACSQTQTGNATVTIQGKPTISLTTQQVTLNEGNNQTFCDTDANSVNSLQFMVLNSCVAGNPVWRVQTGSSTWSEWRSTIPGSQPSNNQPYRYQAACEANCASTYSGVIEVKINYRAAIPQNVSLTADGITVNADESKEICNQEGNVLTFNATCGAGELLLYSVDGGNYSTVVPTQWVDGQYHNYRVRCRKADNTPSCVETESGVMRLRITSLSQVPVATLNVTSGCGTPVAFSGTTTCGSLTTLWYNATTNAALPTLPVQTPNETASYYARCQAEGGCLSEKSNVVTYTVIPVSTAPTVTASAEVVCTGAEVTISTNCPTGTTPFWNTGITESSFKVAFSNVTRQSYWVRCTYSNGCQSAESVRKEIFWKAFELTFINIGQSQSAVKVNDRAAWASQFITPDGGPSLDQSTQVNPTLYFSENANKTAPRFWTIHADACALGSTGSLTFDLLATPEAGVVRSFNTHENNAPYFMYANREGYTELYTQNHPAYGFYQDNGSGGNTYDAGLPRGLYKLGIRYWDQKGQGSIYPSTRQPAGTVLAYQEYWFRIQSKNGIGTGASRQGEILTDNGERLTGNGAFAQVMPNPVSHVLQLQVKGSKGQQVKAVLMDAAGRGLLGRNFVPESHTHYEEWAVQSLPSGVYFLQVTADNQKTILKVIKSE